MLTFLMMAVVGCAEQPDPYAEVTTRLDPETMTIALPLYAYTLSDSESNEVQHANAVLVAACMADQGFDFPRARFGWEAKAPAQDRRYGLWSVELARQWGYAAPPVPGSDVIDEAEAEFGDDWWAAWQGCVASTDQLPLMMPLTLDGEISPVSDGIVETYYQAIESPEFAAIRDEWIQCIKTAGLEPEAGTEIMVPVVPTDEAEAIRAAVADATCKDQNGSIQRAADLEARFEAAYIDEHEAELIEYQEEADRVLEQAREIIANGA